MEKKRAKSVTGDVINLKVMIKIHIQFYFTSTMGCRSETWHFGVFHVPDE